MTSPEEILYKYWRYSGFRPLQYNIIKKVLDRKDTLALLPTGGGKSICFQVPAMMQDGICIVVSPLISLMKDQVDQLKNIGIKAYAIYTGMTKREIDVSLDNCIYGNVKFLYVAPERLKTEIFIARVKQMNVNLLVVDEAHCISQWGYDFRPTYLEIADFREVIPKTPVLALTATATPEVQDDITKQLNFRQQNVIKGSFAREKLSLSVRKVADKDQKLIEILRKTKGSTIVYVNSRKKTKDISVWLRRHNIYSDFYHAGLSHDARVRKQEAWQHEQFRAMIATNAFGMGINKANVRLVVHYDMPSSLEAYYQEAGRAGRDGHIAYAVALCTDLDLKILKEQTEKTYPSADYLRKVYQAVANYLKIAVGSSKLESYDFDINAFAENFKFNAYEVYYALKRLEEEGLVELNESFYHPSKLSFILRKDKLYEYQIANAEHDVLIKAILRLYGGEAFTEFIIVSERQLARFLNTTTYNIIKRLETMHQQGVIVYDKVKDKPQIAFLTARYDATQLPVDVQKLKRRKKLQLGKIDRVERYLANSSQCRMNQISQYFGEEGKYECGICDVCLESKKQKFDDALFKKYAKVVTQYLKNGPKSESEMVSLVKESEKDHMVKTIKMLLEQEKIKVNEGGVLEILIHRQ